MQNLDLITLEERPDMLLQAAGWFHSKWGVPIEEYRNSMEECLKDSTKIPRWYFVLNDKGNIIAGAGIIENDFHDRKDLTPNLCALFVEEEYRNQGIARSILDYARKDVSRLGYTKLYLVTNHTTFYEKCGWEFLTMANDEEGPIRVYAAKAL